MSEGEVTRSDNINAVVTLERRIREDKKKLASAQKLAEHEITRYRGKLVKLLDLDTDAGYGGGVVERRTVLDQLVKAHFSGLITVHAWTKDAQDAGE